MEKKCPKCSSDNILIVPNTDIQVKSRSGCLSIILILLLISSFGIIGIVIVGGVLYQMRGFIYQMRGLIVFVVLLSWYFSIIKKIQGKPAGTASCQSCGKQWGVKKNGETYSSFSIAKVLSALILLGIFIFAGAWIVTITS